MIEVASQVTVVCKFDGENNIIPTSYKIVRDKKIKSYKVNSIDRVTYSVFKGDKSIVYRCNAKVNDSDEDCVIRYNIEVGGWDLFH